MTTSETLLRLAEKLDATRGVDLTGARVSGSTVESGGCDIVFQLWAYRFEIASLLCEKAPDMVEPEVSIWWVPPTILALIIGVVLGALIF